MLKGSRLYPAPGLPWCQHTRRLLSGCYPPITPLLSRAPAAGGGAARNLARVRYLFGRISSVPLSHRSPYPILFALWLTVFAASAQVIIVTPILPDIERALGVAQAHLGWLVTAYAAMLGLFSLAAGPVSDRIGRRRMLLAGSVAMAVALLMHGLAARFETLVAVRALAGAAGGLLSGAAVAYVGDYFPYERRGWANGWVMSGIAAGQILGIPAGKKLTMLLGYRWPFLAFGLVMVGASFLVWRVVPQPRVARAPERVTLRGALRAYAALLRQRAPAAAVVAYVLMFFCIGLFVTYFSVWLERVVGLSGDEVIVLFLCGGLANMATGPFAGRLSDRIGRKPLVVASALLFGACLLAVPFAVTGVVSAVVFFSLVMVSVAMRMAPLQSLVTALVPDQQRGQMMSAAIACGQMGMALGSGLAGVLYGRYGIVGNAIAGAFFVLLMALVVVRGLPEPRIARPALAAA